MTQYICLISYYLLCFIHIQISYLLYLVWMITILKILSYETQIRFSLRTKNKNKQTKNGRKIDLPNLRWEQKLIIRVWK